MIRAALPVLIALTPLNAAVAQDRTGAAQITDPQAPAVQAAEPAETTSEAPPQLSTADEGTAPSTQLTAAGSSHQQPAQVAVRTNDPQPPEPLSTPQQGRTAAIDRVSGNDRCDPGEGRDKASKECRKVIENRAAEYRRAPVTELSPEQKLLIDQQLRENAAEQLAKSGDPSNNNDAMGIAALVLRNNSDEPKPADKKEPDAQSDAAVQAVISVLQGTAPQD